MANKKIDLLVEYISKDDYVSANQLIGSVLEDVQAKRVRILKEDNELNFGDDSTAPAEGDGGLSVGDNKGEQPADNGESGDDDVGNTEGQTEVADDIVETDSIMDEINDIEIKVNKRLILGLLNKLSELSVILNNSELDKNDTQFITFDETMNTYKKILQELQNQTTLAVDQKDVLRKVEILKTKIVDLENDMEQLKTGDDFDQIEKGDEGEGGEEAEAELKPDEGDKGDAGEGDESNQEGDSDLELTPDEGKKDEDENKKDNEISL